MGEVLESDWKIYTKKLPVWQEAYIDNLNKEYIELLSGEGSAAGKFWALEERINKDKKYRGVVCERRRSVMMKNILELLDEGAITLSDLSDFSEDVQESAKSWMNRFEMFQD